MGLILDSSLLIAGERGKFNLPVFFKANGHEAFFIAAITASELLHGVERAETSARRLKRSHFVEDVLAKIPILDFDLAIARRHSALWARLEKNGKMIGPHDLQIAATALEGTHSVATLNRDEFRRVPGLVLAEVQAFVVASH
jgi:tRNA(fMet)-specific endonuclease VapC